MTKEISEILKAYKSASAEGRQTALATVVHVEGSSYRRPGARMLVEDNGRLTGAISGGCLEGDAYRKASLAMLEKRNKLVTYNTMDEDDITFGVQLGCNGIVHILFEPIDANEQNNPIALLEACCSQRKESMLMTLFSLEKYTGEQPGTCLFYDGTISQSNIADKELLNAVFETAASAFTQQSSFLTQLDQYAAFCEWLRPPVSINIVGAGNDTFPLVDMAAILGWQITIIDGRATHANRQRFPMAHNIIVSKADEALARVNIDESTVFVLMTHNYNYDITIMRSLLRTRCRYIGSLGPKKRLERLLNELREEGLTITDEDKERIYGPTGLDIGAESPEEIALSIVAEIKAVLAMHHGASLRNKPVIHSRAEETKTISWQQK